MNRRLRSLVWALLVFTPLLTVAETTHARPPRRVVSLIPSHTEILTALGAADALVGVSNAEPPELYPNLTRVGGLEPNWEMLIAVKPELILADVSHQRFDKAFNRFHLPVLYLETTRVQTIEDVFALMRQVADLMDRRDAAERLIAGLQDRLKALEARLPAGSGPRVYFEIWPRPLQACGPRSLQGHLIARARAVNILGNTRNVMPLVSLEWVARQAPEVIVHTGVVPNEEIAARPAWDKIPAVRDGRLYAVDRDKFSRAGPRIVDAFEELVGLLHGVKIP